VNAIWLMVKGFLSGAWKFLSSIDWRIWLFAAVIIAAWFYGEFKADAREATVNAHWEDAQAKANEKVKKAEVKRDETVERITDWTANEGAIAAADTRAETAGATERVRYVTRTIRVPVGCPTGDPRVLAEGRQAVLRARGAAGQ